MSSRNKAFHYYSHRGRRKHASSLSERLATHILVPILLVCLASLILTSAFLAPFSLGSIFHVAGGLLLALVSSFARLFLSYALCLLIGIPLALFAEQNRHAESFLLPLYDVLESIPIIAFFPVIIIFFVRSNFLEGAAIFMLFFSMIWSVIFNTIGGLKVIPKEVKAVGVVFGLSRWERLTKITLPALFPPLVTGSILALAAGWNIVIVAEALQAYAPQSSHAHDLYGIGSVLVNASLSGNTSELIAAMALLIILITLVNLFIWQPLLAYAEQFKFD
jgi:NitT/TauT family transport system permease protein